VPDYADNCCQLSSDSLTYPTAVLDCRWRRFSLRWDHSVMLTHLTALLKRCFLLSYNCTIYMVVYAELRCAE